MNIRDVIHRDINIDSSIIRELIETKEFQRLRNIKQLGLTFVAFPTAEHSRFMHSIGVYHLVTNLLNVLMQKTDIDFSDEETLSLRIACLLHDLGHGAFSHTSEEFFNFSHEEYTVKIIKDPSTQIHQVLMKHDCSLIDQVVSYIEKKHPNPILNSLLSATIDVDRMDYLMRDSYFTGVSYGEVDIERIFNVIDIKNNQIVFHEKGIKALEDFIISRYNMFSQVYLNKKALAYEIVVNDILEELKKLVDDRISLPSSVDKLIPFFDDTISIDDYLALDDYVFLTLIKDLTKINVDDNTRKIVMLSQAFINKKIVFKEPATYSYKNRTKPYHKKIYNEPVLIYTTNDEIIPLDQMSRLTNFLANDFEIGFDPVTFYIHDEN